MPKTEYRLTEDIEQFFGKEVTLGQFGEYLTIHIAGEDVPQIIGKVVKRKGQKAGPKLAQEA